MVIWTEIKRFSKKIEVCYYIIFKIFKYPFISLVMHRAFNLYFGIIRDAINIESSRVGFIEIKNQDLKSDMRCSTFRT